ncbi:hypothetical protein IMSHALPRED_001326 [Imshaugia aleurites]|uniref:Uncharacterized protein n=1 Tax=Imshaugia aleurites TaxID=172621 RepID=A0A8H3J2A6_9LECA|nr:hypothetical protein IMSHALPRED_001326 [Imshaugia aleurites]
MVNLILPLLLDLAMSGINAASLSKPALGPSIPMDLTDLYSVTNATSLGAGGGGIDPHFSVNYELGDTPLRPIACLMNAVNAMTNLALLDFGGHIPPVVARLPSYPDVVIRSDATTLGRGVIPIRYVLWGIWSFALFMLNNNRYQTMHLTLGFNGGIVGYIRVERPNLQVSSLAGSDSDSSASVRQKGADEALPDIHPSKIPAKLTAVSNTTNLFLTNTTATSSNAGDLHVFIRPIGQTLTNFQFFSPILAGLDFVARFPSTSPVNGFALRPVNVDTYIEFRDFGTQPRRQAPFFEYQWVVRALGELPWHLMPLMRWSEAIIVMQVDGISVGDGGLQKRAS